MSSKYVILRVKVGLEHGLLGKYYTWSGENPPEDFDENCLKCVRIDKAIDFVWWDEPVPGLGDSYFGVVWTGYLYVPTDGEYRFYVVTDDGSRLWIDNNLIIHSLKTFT